MAPQPKVRHSRHLSPFLVHDAFLLGEFSGLSQVNTQRLHQLVSSSQQPSGYAKHAPDKQEHMAPRQGGEQPSTLPIIPMTRTCHGKMIKLSSTQVKSFEGARLRVLSIINCMENDTENIQPKPSSTLKPGELN